MEELLNRSIALLTVYNDSATNATRNATLESDCRQWSESSVLPELACDEKSVAVLRSVLLTCAAVFVIVLVVLCTLVLALMLQVRKLGALIRSLRAATGSSAVEVCSGLLTAPELRSSFQSKAKKSNKKTAKFTDPQDTACSAPRDVDEEEL